MRVFQMYSDIGIVYGVFESVLRATKEQTFLYLYDYIGGNDFVPIPKDGRIGKLGYDLHLIWYTLG